MIPPFVIAAAESPGIVTLSGTSGSPNVSTDTETSGTATAGWRILTTGRLQRIVASSYAAFSDEAFSKGGTAISTDQDLWIRATLDSGDTPDRGTLGSWEKCCGSGSAVRTWEWDRATNGSTVGTVQFDIATDSGGTNIVATGYYQGDAERTA